MKTPDSAPSRLLTPQEVAAMFRVDSRTVARWASKGKIPAVKTPGGKNRFRAEDVEAFFSQEQA